MACGSAPRRWQRLGGLILIPAVAAIVTVVAKVMNPVAPSPEGLTGIALGALAVNLVCAVLLMQLRGEGSSLATGAWLAARNDALANLLIIVGAIIAVINLSAAKEVWEASREEHDSVEEAFADMDDD